MENITFIGGIHGSGKGNICLDVVKNTDLIHLTASEVLKWDELSRREEKVVKDINFTQDRLVTNLKAIIDMDKNYLLDGHYCLLNKMGIPEKIPIDTFSGIKPSKLILVITNPETIKLRLEKRDSKNYELNLINDFQSLEALTAKEVSEHLKVPLFIIKSEEYNITNLLNFLK